MSSLSDQLLKAGLVTEEQVKKAVEKPRRNAKPQKRSRKKQSPKQANKKEHAKKTLTDLEKFYQERAKVEQKEKQQAIRAKKEAARIKKETQKQINSLISENLLNDAAADIRYNFVIGTTIKYLFVTEQQQQGLIDGKLAITFLRGKRSLIPVEIAKRINKLDPKKIVIIPAEISTPKK